MIYKLVHDSGLEYNTMALEIVDNNNSVVTNMVYSPTDVLDAVARKLSLSIPDSCIKAVQFGQTKAVYEKGERTNIRNYKDLYSDLTEEEYGSTKILCSETNEWI